jgi:hypothetical protein
MSELTNLRKILKKNDLFMKIILIILFFVSLLIFIKPISYNFYPDFASYYYSALTFLRGGNPYVDQTGNIGIFLYPPTALLFIIPFTLTKLVIAGRIFTLFSTLSFFISVFILIKMVKVSPLSSIGLLLFALSFNLFPAKFTLGMGQINNLVLLLIVLFVFYYMRKKWITAGFFLAIATLLKVFPAILILIPIIDNRWKTVLAFLISASFLILITYPIVGKEIFSHFFLETLPSLYSNVAGSYYNQSFAAFLIRLVNNNYMFNIVRPLFGVSILSISLILIVKFNRMKHDMITTTSILIALSIILTSNSWQHHYVWSIVPLILTFGYITKNFKLEHLMCLGFSYLFIALNIKTPNNVHVFFWSHSLWGILIIYFLNVYFLVKKIIIEKK